MTKPEWPIRHRWPLKIWFWGGADCWRNSFHIEVRWLGITYWHIWFI